MSHYSIHIAAKQKALTPEMVVTAVADYYGIGVDALAENTRSAPVVRRRRLAVLLLDKLTGCSTVQIGRMFNQHHTTIMHALRAGYNALVDDEIFKSDFDQMCAILGRPEEPYAECRYQVMIDGKGYQLPHADVLAIERLHGNPERSRVFIESLKCRYRPVFNPSWYLTTML